MSTSSAGIHPVSLAERFAARFRGLERAYGCYVEDTAPKSPGKKVEGRAQTVRKQVTLSHYQRHLAGEKSLGIVPIADNARCWFAAIDIDVYDGFDFAALQAKVEQFALPLVLVRSKSGGCHAYFFGKEALLAELVHRKLREWAAALGHPKAEIFPKQTKLEPDGFGNWINLPYFGGDASDRYAIREGQRLTLQQFLDVADATAVTETALRTLVPRDDGDDTDVLYEAPPCLQHLARDGCAENRNNGLFNFGVYARKRHGDAYVDKLDEYNQALMDPPLGHKEVADVVKSVGKKDYGYKCKDLPIRELCDREVCLTREYGIGEGSKEAKKPDVTSIVLAILAKADVELWHTRDGEAFASLTINGHREHLRVRSSDFRRFLIHGVGEVKGRALPSQGLQAAIDLIDARAFHDGPEYKIAVRIAEADGVIYHDLANPEREVVRIDAIGWSIIEDAPVRFYRPETMHSLPRPARGGDIIGLRGFITIQNENAWRLLVGFLVSCFRAHGPYWQLHVNGTHGSAKSTLSRMILDLIDPSEAGLRTLSRDEHNLVIAARRTHLLGFDNLSGLPSDLSDALCRLSTGGGLGTRKLYSDDEERVFRVMRPVVLNGIPEMATRPDLRDRSLRLDLPPLDDCRRKDEQTLWAEFNSAKPAILGGLYDAVSCALREWDSTILTDTPRMADATRWVSAAEPALGWERGSFLKTYMSHRDESVERAVEQDAFASAVLQLAEEADYELPPARLLDALTDKAGDHVARQPFWPKSPRALTSALQRAAPDLAKLGVIITRPPRGTERRIFIGKEGRKGDTKTGYEEESDRD